MRCALLVAALAFVPMTLQAAEPAKPEAKPAAPAEVAKPAVPAVALSDGPAIPEPIRQLLQDRNYPEAIQAIDAALAAKHPAADYLLWLKGRAQHLAGQLDAALATFESLEKEHPKSPWLRRARFSRAITLARKGDFRAAELIYRGEAEYLLSVDRKQEIAGLYLEFADAYFKPPKEEQKPDFAKALEFYKRALEVGPKPEKRAEVELLIAQCHQRLGKLDEAIGLYAAFIKERDAGPLAVEARYDLGDCQMAKGDLRGARRTWQDLLAKYPDSREERIAEASYRMSRTYGIPPGEPPVPQPQAANPPVQLPAQQAPVQLPVPAPAAPGPSGPQSSEALTLGVAALESFIEKFPTHRLASKAYLDIAVSYLHFGRFDDAAKTLQRLLADPRYREREETAQARYLLGNALRMQGKFTEAIAVWQEYLVKHPTHKQWSTAQREIVDTEYLMAKERFDAKQYDAAAKLWAEFQAKYPLDPRDPEILLHLGWIEFHQEKYDAAIAAWRRLVSKYPNTEPSSQAQFQIATTFEQKLGKLEEALEEYKKVTWGSQAGLAQQAIARLTAKRMTLATERVYRSFETPKLALTTRNLESVTVRAYKVDLETYFRKMHLAQGVERLDIALISPDRNFEFPVPKYAKHQELQSQIDVPLPGELHQGVMAVTVSSKTLEATTLLIQSDLDIVVKSSRNEVFVFAENMKTGQPWPGVRLLISNGKQVFAEGTTGKDGVFRGEFKELAQSDDVRVFATIDGHVASNMIGLQGVGIGQGLADKGFLYSDRPAYRPGQMVHLRGCLRKAEKDAYIIEKGRKFTLDVLDSRNRLVRQEPVALSEQGTFHTHFILPPTSPQGEYRFTVRDETGRAFTGTFLVQEYVLEPVRIAVDTPRRVYYRGEEIEGTIRVQFYYGAPLAGREIRYQLAGDRQYTATTDGKGEVRFKLPTREFSESQVLPLVVTLPERNLQTGVNFVLAVQGFSIELTTVRPVYVAGETFELVVKTHDAEGKPLGKKLALQVLQQTTIDGKPGERETAKYDLETAADGSGRQTLKLDKGGRYTLRVTGVDQFKNAVAADYAVQISDDEDEVRLRILADRYTYKAGETASVQLLWREEPTLALVTFQGARVLEHRFVELQSGPNKLEIPMNAGLAPNFELAVAVLYEPLAPREKPGIKVEPAAKVEKVPAPKVGQVEPAAKVEAKAVKPERKIKRFHIASSPFTVERELKVVITAKRQGNAQGPVQPGEEIDVEVITTDPQGRPVPAELSLAMVEQSLLDRFPGREPSIAAFFRGTPRETAVRTTASIVFAYHPTTVSINLQLLAEAERREVAKEEAESRKDALLLMATPRVVVQEELEESSKLAEESAPMLEKAQQQVEAEGELNAPAAPAGFAPQSNAGFGARTRSYARNGVAVGRGVQLKPGQQPAMQMQQAMRVQNQASDPQGQESLGLQIDVAGVPFSTDGKVLLGTQVYPVADLVIPAPTNGTVVLWDAPAVDSYGRLQNWRFGEAGKPFDRARFDATVAEMNKAGAVLVATSSPQETGYWNPAIATDKDGRATLKILMPDRATAWRLSAKGITADTLAGETTSDLTVKKNLFGELKLPLAFTDGDEAELLATVHNDAVDKGPIEVVLKTTIGGRSVEEKKTLDAGKGIHEMPFKLVLRRPDEKTQPGEPANIEAAFELTVTAGAQRDVLRRAVPLLPYGMPVYATAGGSADADTTAWVELPANVPLDGASLEVHIGPTVERSLLDIVLAPAPRCQIESARLASGLDAATSDLMAALALTKLVGTSRDAAGPQSQTLDGRVRSSITLLISSQLDDGGWSWSGRGGAADRNASARAVWALALAKSQGYPVPDDNFNKALAFLKNQAAATDNADYESKAVLLHALAVAGQGDFALANRLYRERPQLSPAALAYLALAFAEMDRKPTASELLALLKQKNLDALVLKREAAGGVLPWNQSPAELRALAALAWQKVTPKAPEAKEQVDWLLAHRTGYRWSPDKATGPATLALGMWFAETQVASDRYKLAVFVNDLAVQTLEIDPQAATQTVAVPHKLLKPGKQRVNFQITGRGRYAYQCILGGFVPAEKLVSTSKGQHLNRVYEPAPIETDGREVPRGYSTTEGALPRTVSNPLTQVPVGQRGHVRLEMWRQDVPYNLPQEQMEYWVVTEPIPCGMSVLEKSIQGDVERYEIEPGQITFYLGRKLATVQYDLVGYLPGAYRAAPTVVRNAYRPEQFLVAKPKSLAVLAAGSKSVDAYEFTPDELFELGKRAYAKGDWKSVVERLAEMIEKWPLRAEPYKEAVQKLLDAHLEIGPPGKVVRYFEIVKERWPAEEIPFAKIMRVGAAYHEMGEYERSYLIFRATVESSFVRESGVAGFLDSRGEFLRSVDVMGRLLREYPPEGYTAAAHYALAQRVYAKANEDDAKLREKKINRVDLVRRAWSMLEQFLTAWPDDPAADQGAFAAANALLELKAFDQAAAACGRYAQRYPKSDLLDSFWYIIGYCHFAAGRHREALEVCGKVAETRRVDPRTGAQRDSSNKWQAVYILGQVHHSLGEAAQAIVEYRRVEDRFADAKEAILYFTRKAIDLPEVTTVKPGTAAEVELKFRNLPACDVKVYAIDLMKFSLLKRNLGEITQINLAGIRPYYETTLKLGDGKDYRDRIERLPLPLKEEGAYLVVCRGEDLHASGLVLVTPLAVEVQEDQSAGRVRTTVKDVAAGRYVHEVHVKVIGSRNPDFVSGATDLRGVFVADGIQGTSTVIAEIEPNRYAFFRGKTELGAPPAPTTAVPQLKEAKPADAKAAQPAPAASVEKQLLEGVQRQNSAIQGEQMQNLQRMYDRQQKGVEAQKAY